jgi:hypothetical protein
MDKKEAAAVVRGGKSLVRVNDLQALRGSLKGIIIWTDFTFPGTYPGTSKFFGFGLRNGFRALGFVRFFSGFGLCVFVGSGLQVLMELDC